MDITMECSMDTSKVNYSRTSQMYFMTNKAAGDAVNCCWCGAIMAGLKWDALQMKPVKWHCSKCGKPHNIQFNWSLTIEATPIQ